MLLFPVPPRKDWTDTIIPIALSRRRSLPPFSDRDAKRLYIWASVLATYDITAVLFSTWVADFGLNYNVYAMVYGTLTLIGLVGNILMILFTVWNTTAPLADLNDDGLVAVGDMLLMFANWGVCE